MCIRIGVGFCYLKYKLIFLWAFLDVTFPHSIVFLNGGAFADPGLHVDC